MQQFTNDSVRYAGITKLIEIAVEVAEERNINKPVVLAKIERGFKIYACLQALEYHQFLSRQQKEKIWYCLVEIGGLTDFPIAPLLGQVEQPAILIGTGTTIINNITYTSGTAFENSDVTLGTETVDTFPMTSGRSATWFYTVTNNDTGGAVQRAGHLQGTWLADGASFEYRDEGTNTIDGPLGLTISMDVSAGAVRLRATSADDSYTVSGIRLLY